MGEGGMGGGEVGGREGWGEIQVESSDTTMQQLVSKRGARGGGGGGQKGHIGFQTLPHTP